MPVDQQIEKAIVMLQYWVSSYWSSFLKHAIDDPFGAANAVARLLAPAATLIGSVILFLNYRNEVNKRFEEREANKNAAQLSEYRFSEERKKNADDAKRAEARLISERFSKAIEQLSDGNRQVRAGGIYSLEKIAKDSPNDYWTIIEVLTGFLREISPSINNECIADGVCQEQLLSFPSDRQAALTVILRRDSSKDQRSLNLSGTSFVNADFTDFENSRDINKKRPDLVNANLSNSDLRNANLCDVNLRDANLKGCDLRSADLTCASLRNANLSSANLSGNTQLRLTEFKEADLSLSNFRKAKLAGAQLENATMIGAQLQGADLMNLMGGIELAYELREASFDQETIMPNRKAYSSYISLENQCILPERKV